MKATKNVSFTLKLTPEEYRWLTNLMCDPICIEDRDYDEPPEFLEMRGRFARELLENE
jgi:hypothetical protein